MGAGCAVCGAPATPEARFCPRCGRPLRGLDTSGEVPYRYASPLAYTPPHLTERILQNRSALEGEHKLVTVLFCDVVNSTELAGRIGPERMHTLVDRLFRLALDEVHHYEGTINQFLGDGFMALFGAPLALEHHERGAVLAALAIRRRVVEELGDTRVSVRFGLNTGLVVVGKIGDNLRMDYTAVGDTTNIAARLQALADPQGILASDTTCGRIQELVVAESLGPLSLRGKPEPVVTHRIVGPRPSRGAFPEAESRRLSPFVGRASELQALQRALDEALAERGQAIGIVGDPGVGKSRLLREFRETLAAQRVTYLEGRCLSYGASIPYFPILDLLRANCGLADTDTQELIAAKVRAALEEVGMAADEWSPYLLHLLGLKDTGAALESLSPGALRERTLETIRQLTLRGSQRRSLIVVVEDLHWVDQASEEFFDTLAESLAGAAILFIGTYRPGHTPAWINRSYATQVALRPLSQQDSETIVRSAAPATTLPDTALQTILQRGEGNPFFLEELSHVVVEQPTAALARTIPRTLHGLLMARVDRLPEDTKHLLQLASVIGREFPTRLLAAVADAPGGLEPLLRELARREFMYQRVRGEDSVCAFKHALTRDVVYDSLLEGRKQSDHAAVGAALEMLYAGRTDEVAELLAHHFMLSTVDEKAVDYAVLAAGKAQRRWANAEALALWEDAIDRLTRMPETESNRDRRIDAVIRQAEVRFALGQHTGQIEALEGIRALVEAADPERRATWHYWTGFLHSLTGSRPETAIEHCQEASRIAEAHGLEEIRAYAETCLAQAYLCAGRLADGLEAGERALAVFESRGNRWWAFRALSQLSSIANARGEWERSLGYCQRTLEHGQAMDDLRLKVTALARAASTHIQRGACDLGLQLCNEALALSPTPFDAAALRAIHGLGLVKTGHPDEGTAEIEETLAWYDRSHLRYTRLQFTLWLAEGHLRRADRPRARALAEEVLAASRELGYRHLEGVALRLLGEAALPDDPAAAAAPLEAARQLFDQIGARNELARTLGDLAHVARLRGDHAQDTALTREADRVYTILGTRGSAPSSDPHN